MTSPGSKLCDVADWFEPELPDLILTELRELPRFHRKQWEFGMILRELRARHLLQGGGRGLSMGGGRERLLYAVGRHVGRLVVTDLYDGASTWAEARTDDPDDFVRSCKPFPVDDARIEARRMDMRQLEFEAAAFDFCYSSCAIEHIGGHDDFLRHLAEAHRVLRDGGVYVLTTELHYGPETIEHPGDYVFSATYLNDLFSESAFQVDPVFDARLARHRANLPLPGNLSSYASSADSVWPQLLEQLPHLQLLRGAHPHTSALFVLRKGVALGRVPRIEFRGLEEARAFVAQGVAQQRSLVQATPFALAPFAYLLDGRSAFVACDPPVAASAAATPDADDTLFHTDYVWLGSGRRAFCVGLAASRTAGGTASIGIRVHRLRTLGPAAIECAGEIELSLGPGDCVTRRLELPLDDGCCYAVLGKLRSGCCQLESVEVMSRPAG
jgi:SAM-dependent methyltransferase